MAGWLHGVFVGEWLFVFPLCGFSLSLFCDYCLDDVSCERTRMQFPLTSSKGLCVVLWGISSMRIYRGLIVFDFAPAHLPAADPVLHMSAPVRRGAVADARLGLA